MALALIILLVGTLVTRLVRTAVGAALRRTKMRAASVLLATRLAGFGVWLLVATIVLSTLQLQAIVLGISGVLALLGAAFVSSASGIANDIIAGFFLASDRDLDRRRIRSRGNVHVDSTDHLNLSDSRLVASACLCRASTTTYSIGLK